MVKIKRQKEMVEICSIVDPCTRDSQEEKGMDDIPLTLRSVHSSCRQLAFYFYFFKLGKYHFMCTYNKGYFNLFKGSMFFE